jgi:hypothetical protein
MCRAITLVAAVTMLLPRFAHARLWETVAQIENRFGPPVQTWAVKSGEQDRRYRYKQYKVLVTYVNGRSASELYMHADTASLFPDAEVKSLLDDHSLGNRWERPLAEPMWYMTAHGKNERIAAAAYYPKLPRVGEPAFTVLTATYARRHHILHI